MKDQIYALLESNMRAMYETYSEWNAVEKRTELEDPVSRFLLVVPKSYDARTTRRTTRHSATTVPPLLGYVMWRYETYDALAHDSVAVPGEDQMEVAYWYAASSDAAMNCRWLPPIAGSSLGHGFCACLRLWHGKQACAKSC